MLQPELGPAEQIGRLRIAGVIGLCDLGDVRSSDEQAVPITTFENQNLNGDVAFDETARYTRAVRC
jgi:hypothetical protein